jgi:4-hydroxybenzoate polyprenyltransferase
VQQALGWLAVQLLLGLAVVVHLPPPAIAAAFATLPIVAAYPLMKRVTNWPQVVLGFAFNSGVWVGWAAATAALPAGGIASAAASVSLLLSPAFYTPLLSVCLPVYVAGVCWTVVYDTIYAWQDARYDAALGLRSTALHFGTQERTRAALALFAVVMLAALASAGQALGMGAAYFAISVGAPALHLLWQLATLNIHDPARCMRLFVANRWIGALIAIGIVLDKLFVQRSGDDAPQNWRHIRKSLDTANAASLAGSAPVPGTAVHHSPADTSASAPAAPSSQQRHPD